MKYEKYPSIKGYWNWHYPFFSLRNFISILPYRLRDCYWRIRYGWCPTDCWDMETWLLTTLPNMLRYLTQHHWAYKSYEEPESYDGEHNDKWEAFLWGLSDKLIECREDYWENQNEFIQTFYKEFEKDKKVKLDPRYFERARELEAERQKHMSATFKELGENLTSLWD